MDLCLILILRMTPGVINFPINSITLSTSVYICIEFMRWIKSVANFYDFITCLMRFSWEFSISHMISDLLFQTSWNLLHVKWFLLLSAELLLQYHHSLQPVSWQWELAYGKYDWHQQHFNRIFSNIRNICIHAWENWKDMNKEEAMKV